MSDLRDLPDVAGDVRDRVVLPPYDEVSRRVRARRLRGTVGGVAAAVLVVGGLAVWQSVATTAGPSFDPADPTVDASQLPPTDEQLWRQVVDGTDAHPFEISGTSDGAVAVVWRALEQPEPTFALVIREADGTVHGRRLDEPITLTPVPGGWVGLRPDMAWTIRSDGSWTELAQPGLSRSPRAGDVVVTTVFGPAVYSPDEDTWSFLSIVRTVDQAYVTPDGTLVSCARVGDRVHVRRDEAPSTPQALAFSESCVLTGNGDVISVLGLGDEPDGDIPLTGFTWSNDGGVTWQAPPRRKFTSVTSQAVSTNGTTIVSGSDGMAFVIHPDTSYTHPDVPLGQVFAAGERLYATSYAQSSGPLLVSDDDGLTWQETTLPGMESSEE